MPGARPYSQRRMLPRNIRPFRPKHSPVLRCVQKKGTVSCLWGIAEAEGRENKRPRCRSCLPYQDTWIMHKEFNASPHAQGIPDARKPAAY